MAPVKQASTTPSSKSLVGKSPAFNRMLEQITRVAGSDVTVLLQGETGVGKEVVAKMVHEQSSRMSQSFATVECSGLSDSLFESELFGHVKGAFTGAINNKVGLAETATKGTLFLDEVGDIPLSQQVKLLRLIETGVFRPVGIVQTRHTDFRLICATHRNLQEMVKAGDFRQDLYYRLSTFPIDLPPLRAHSRYRAAGIFATGSHCT
jgi:two-component system response regulator HydG